MPTLAIVGGGLAGLTMLRWARAEGVDATLFEARDAIGGNWRFREDGPSVFRGTELTSSSWVTGFSDCPLPDGGPDFVRHEGFLAHLERYADQHGLHADIRCGTTVVETARDSDRWVVTTERDGAEQSESFDAVAVCTGLSRTPAPPDIPGLGEPGPAPPDHGDGRGPSSVHRPPSPRVLHSADYVDATPFAGQRVLVVGGGESAADILAELAAVCPAVHLSLRRGVLVFPKALSPDTLPADHFHCRATYQVPRPVYATLEEAFGPVVDLGFLLEDARQGRPNPARAARIRRRLRRASGGRYHDQYIIKSDSLLRTLARDDAHLHGELVRFDGPTAVFADGSSCRPDVVILATGFRIDFPFLPIPTTGWRWTRLYKTVLHPDLPGMGFIGFGRPDIGAIPPVTELQARWFAGVVSGRLTAPSGAHLLDAIARDAARTRRHKPVAVGRTSGIVEFVPYQYDLAALIGCRPRLRRLLTRPRLLWAVLFGTVSPPMFRLHGPHASPDAADLLTTRGLQPHRPRHALDVVAMALLAAVWAFPFLALLPLWLLLERLAPGSHWAPRIPLAPPPPARPPPALARPRLPARVALRTLSLLGRLGLGDWMMSRAIRQHLVSRPGRFADYTPVPGDAFVCTFAKSGSNWMLQLALQTAWRGRADFDHLHQLVPWPENPLRTVVASLDRPVRSRDGVQVVKTHLDRDQMPFHADGKYIVVLRHPADVVVSAYHFARGVMRSVVDGDVTPDQWLAAFLDDRFFMGSWAAHTASWWAVRDAPNVRLFTFRQMKADLPGVADEVARFLGVARTDAERAAILERSGYPWMKAHTDRFRAVIPPIRAEPAPMVRRGEVGSASELYTLDQRAAIVAHAKAGLAERGCDLPFDALFGRGAS